MQFAFFYVRILEIITFSLESRGTCVLESEPFSLQGISIKNQTCIIKGDIFLIYAQGIFHLTVSRGYTEENPVKTEIIFFLSE